MLTQKKIFFICLTLAIILGIQYSKIEVPKNFDSPNKYKINFCIFKGLFLLVLKINFLLVKLNKQINLKLYLRVD